ncbi:hypothetical protein [Hymenobacter psychrophilus]|uniref:Uncharacterized protein n=1 Tax=Hymenobacter psychrophilus TaxID=651662 RepID=A0A1H3FHK2_9BACT|nr:hypothetical protein [Hymenobacter psychrophilus]SDX90522.1 hypothetical protein SAMN04488069_10482 [Hymenobacter psychrophilus]
MTYAYTPSNYSTIIRTLILWLLSNIGGTLWLTLDFAYERLEDYPIALMVGLTAALTSLAIVPLVVPFFVLMSRLQADWPRRTVALTGIILFFLLANQVLLGLIPMNSVAELLPFSLPYGIAAVLGVLWLYGPARHVAAPSQRTR